MSLSICRDWDKIKLYFKLLNDVDLYYNTRPEAMPSLTVKVLHTNGTSVITI